jgi:hypothetical protein
MPFKGDSNQHSTFRHILAIAASNKCPFEKDFEWVYGLACIHHRGAFDSSRMKRHSYFRFWYQKPINDKPRPIPHEKCELFLNQFDVLCNNSTQSVIVDALTNQVAGKVNSSSHPRQHVDQSFTPRIMLARWLKILMEWELWFYLAWASHDLMRTPEKQDGLVRRTEARSLHYILQLFSNFHGL